MKRGMFTALFVILIKSVKLTALWKVLKLLKFTKFLITFLTMGLSAFVYAFWLGPWFSIGFVIMLFIHEMGHVMAMKIKGMPTSAPVFIPMLGAVIFAPKFKNKQDEAFVGYAGPLIGGLAALALFGVWALLPSPSELILLVSYTAAFINLFNLIPIRPLDGGRTTQVIGEWFKWVGLSGLLLFTLYVREPAFLLLWILILDGMDLKPWRKVYIGVICQVSMMVLMFAGYSDQKWWVNGIDMLIASVLNICFWSTAHMSDEKADENITSEPVAMEIRVRWFMLYLALVIGLILLIMYQMPYLPHPVRSS